VVLEAPSHPVVLQAPLHIVELKKLPSHGAPSDHEAPKASPHSEVLEAPSQIDHLAPSRKAPSHSEVPLAVVLLQLTPLLQVVMPLIQWRWAQV